MELSSYINAFLYINCTNCDGANLIGLSKLYKNRGKDIHWNLFGGSNYPFKRSGALQLLTDFRIFDNQIFQFNGSSIVSISSFFIPKVYDFQPYIIGKLEFSNGIFNIPSCYGNGNFSIYIKDKLVHTNPFSYQPPSKKGTITSFILTFFITITSIKYNDKNGKDLDYNLIEPNIISLTLNTYSTNAFSFNDDYHNETLPNGLLN
ncbi:hypothetical protein ACTFIT_006916 [Dictyostelium discoideum]